MTIYAELSKGQAKDKMFELPYGVRLERKESSSACYFECDSRESKEELMIILDSQDVSWQDQDPDEYKEEDEGKKRSKKRVIW